MSGWHNGPLVAFDVESTGVDPFDARIVTASLASILPGEIPTVQSWLVDPGVDIPEAASAIHGVTTERARAEGSDPLVVCDAIASRLVAAWRDGVPAVVMNAPYDVTLLEVELARHGLATLSERCQDGRVSMLIVDPLVLDRHFDRYRKGKKRLADLCRVYGVVNDAEHDAAGDALAAARCAWRIAERYDLGGVDLVELQERQTVWHFEWAEHFEAFMRERVDAECVIERDWPVREGVAS